jgi:hypothetical protein
MEHYKGWVIEPAALYTPDGRWVASAVISRGRRIHAMSGEWITFSTEEAAHDYALTQARRWVDEGSPALLGGQGIERLVEAGR